MSNSIVQPARRVLVVDDNPAIHEDFRKILSPSSGGQDELEAIEAKLYGEVKPVVESVSFQIDSATQGQAGFDLVQKSIAAGQPYALAFIDVRMPPGWDGIETTSEIWKIDQNIQVVICTAYSDYSWEEMIAKLGISHRLVILKKPFDAVEVLQLAHALTEKWELQQKDRARMDQLEEMVAQRTHELQVANQQLKTEMVERAQAEEALRQSQKMESLGQLAGGIAHDFNNLLTIIRGYVQCLIVKEPQDPETLKDLHEIDTAAERAAKLTSQMLMFSRKKRLQPQDLNVNELIAQIGKTLKRLLGENIAVEIRCQDAPMPIHADPVMIEQVILNLAINARDAMPQGGQLLIHADAIEIKDADVRRYSKVQPGKFACLSVTDTGCGIAPEALPHLFEPFYTTKGPGKGTGLGLATAYGIVKQHDGWIEVKSEQGRGSTFKIFLPISIKKPGPDTSLPSKTPVTGGRETILLVEDEQAVRSLVRLIIQRHGYRVLEAGSGVEALSIWDEHGAEIDLLLTDMVMPEGLSGRELAEKILEKKSDLKVIYTSGYSPDVISHNLTLIDGLNFLAKPYHPDSLLRTIRNCLDKPAGVNCENVNMSDEPQNQKPPVSPPKIELGSMV